MNSKTITAFILTLVLSTTLAVAMDHRVPRVQGRVVELSDVEGFDQLTIITSTGVRMTVRLGQTGTCRGLVTEGDQVRIRLLNRIQVNSTPLAMRMKVRRTGATYRIRNTSGKMNQQWAGTRARDGSCGRTPGTGCPREPQCPSGGGGAGGSRGGGTGGGNGGSRGGGTGTGGGGR